MIFFKNVFFSGKVQLKCSQTGDKFVTKLCNLSNEAGESISIDDARPGLKVLANLEGRAYPAEIITLDGMHIH